MAKQTINRSGINKDDCYTILKHVNVRGANRTHKNIRVEIITAKMVQCQFSLASDKELVDHDPRDPSMLCQMSEDSKKLLKLPASTVKISKDGDGKQSIKWISGDYPQYDNNQVITNGHPAAPVTL